MGMGGHPITIHQMYKYRFDHSLEHGSLFNPSHDVDDSPSVTDSMIGASVHCTDKCDNESALNMAIHTSIPSNQWVSIQVTDASALTLNKKEADAFLNYC